MMLDVYGEWGILMAEVSTVVKNVSKPEKFSLASVGKGIFKSRYLYIIFVPVILYYVIFHYLPMYGLLIAFQEYNPFKGIWGSKWVGLKHVESFINSVFFWRLLRNTIAINLYGMIVGFPAPIILALMMNEVRNNFFKKAVQTTVYLPNFISTVVVCGMIVSFLSPSSGIINALIKMLGGQSIHFLAEPGWFWSIYVWSGVWQGAGWGSIIYLAALAGLDPTLYEAAIVDGASSWKRLWHITIPGIMPTIIIMLIMNMGSIFSVGYEKIILLYNANTYPTADVINTYVYRRGILKADFSYSTAISFFNNIINFIMLVTVNKIARKVGETSLW